MGKRKRTCAFGLIVGILSLSFGFSFGATVSTQENQTDIHSVEGPCEDPLTQWLQSSKSYIFASKEDLILESESIVNPTVESADSSSEVTQNIEKVSVAPGSVNTKGMMKPQTTFHQSPGMLSLHGDFHFGLLHPEQDSLVTLELFEDTAASFLIILEAYGNQSKCGVGGFIPHSDDFSHNVEVTSEENELLEDLPDMVGATDSPKSSWVTVEDCFWSAKGEIKGGESINVTYTPPECGCAMLSAYLAFPTDNLTIIVGPDAAPKSLQTLICVDPNPKPLDHNITSVPEDAIGEKETRGNTINTTVEEEQEQEEEEKVVEDEEEETSSEDGSPTDVDNVAKDTEESDTNGISAAKAARKSQRKAERKLKRQEIRQQGRRKDRNGKKDNGKKKGMHKHDPNRKKARKQWRKERKQAWKNKKDRKHSKRKNRKHQSHDDESENEVIVGDTSSIKTGRSGFNIEEEEDSLAYLLEMANEVGSGEGDIEGSGDALDSNEMEEEGMMDVNKEGRMHKGRKGKQQRKKNKKHKKTKMWKNKVISPGVKLCCQQGIRHKKFVVYADAATPPKNDTYVEACKAPSAEIITWASFKFETPEAVCSFHFSNCCQSFSVKWWNNWKQKSQDRKEKRKIWKKKHQQEKKKKKEERKTARKADRKKHKKEKRDKKNKISE